MMKTTRSEEKKVIHDIRNLFRLKKKLREFKSYFQVTL